MKLIVAGSRSLRLDAGLIKMLIEHNDIKITEIVSGKANGIDKCGELVAKVFNYELKKFPADWETHGKAAGILRNMKMLKEGKPDMVIAFPGGRGTENMKFIAREAGVEVIEVG